MRERGGRRDFLGHPRAPRWSLSRWQPAKSQFSGAAGDSLSLLNATDSEPAAGAAPRQR